MRCTLVLTVALSAIFQSAVCLGFSGNDIYHSFRHSVVKISVEGTKQNGEPHFPENVGSGFIVHSKNGQTVVVTAAHVVEKRSYWEASDTDKPRRTIKISKLNSNDNLVEIATDVAVIEQDDDEDWAILQFNGSEYPATHMGDSIGVAENAYLLGFPANSPVVDYSPGDVKAFNYVEEIPFLRLHMAVEKGQSGGPIFDNTGRVVGIASANDRDVRFDFHLSVPINRLKGELVKWIPANSNFWDSPEAPIESEIMEQDYVNNSYGLKLNAVNQYHYYKDGGDFLGVITYDVTNTSNFPITDLFPDKAGWDAENVDAEHQFKILSEDKKNFHSLERSLFVPVHREENYYGEEKLFTYFLWVPRIAPGLKQNEELIYGIEINTKDTEKPAFRKDGSYAGMATNYPTNQLNGEFHAPPNYEIILQGHIIRDREGGLIKDHPKIEEPMLSENRKRVTWKVESPVPAALYLISLRFKPE
jgi:hypothetical protein